MDGLSLVPLVVFGCLGELSKLNLSQSALHPLRRRANSARRDAPRFTTLPTTTSAPGALLLSSYLLVHLLLPRMRTLNMDSSAENAVCLRRDAPDSSQNHSSLTLTCLPRPTDRAFDPLKSVLPQRPRRQQLHTSNQLPILSTMRAPRRREFPKNVHTKEAVCAAPTISCSPLVVADGPLHSITARPEAQDTGGEGW
jgi:hypothetical protein